MRLSTALRPIFLSSTTLITSRPGVFSRTHDRFLSSGSTSRRTIVTFASKIAGEQEEVVTSNKKKSIKDFIMSQQLQTSVSVTNNGSSDGKTSYLEQARSLPMPSREEMLQRDPSVSFFWEHFSETLSKAWEEWQYHDPEGTALPKLMNEKDALFSSLIDVKLRETIEAAWNNPSKETEQAVKDLWEEVAPGVYQTQFFNPSEIYKLREYFNKAHEANIPVRPPYGITLNRKGFMIDPRSDGYLAIPEFQTFYKYIMDTYTRPLARAFFPNYITSNEDSETFGFTIEYQPSKDQGIRQHSDSSALTLNINLNLPPTEKVDVDHNGTPASASEGKSDNNQWTGSSLIFFDRETGERRKVDFAPGVAVMHRGATPHAALPITSGSRTNMVLWVYGKGGRTAHFPYDEKEHMTVKERWTKPKIESSESKDTWAPF